jgi:ribosomal RNA-processing protein 36
MAARARRPQQKQHSGDSDDEDYSNVSFGALSKAQDELLNQSESESDSESDSDGPPEESDSRYKNSKNNSNNKRRNKHAPTESSSKKPVSWIRGPTAETSQKSSSLYQDIRFDTAYGKADLQKARKNYAFLNEYRESEVREMRDQLQHHPGLNDRNKQDLRRQIQQTESRLRTFKDRDFEMQVLQDYKKKVKSGEIKGPLHLKRSDQRKLILSEKFKVMKSKDVNKALERKRKRNTAKERKLMPSERRS